MKSATKTYSVDLPQTTVVTVLGDLKQFAQFHPLILSATEIPETSGKFKIIEKPFPKIPFKISYFAKRLEANIGISYEITGIPFTKALMAYCFKAIDEKVTQVTWRVDVDSRLPIENWLAQKMLGAQNVLIGNLNRA